MCSKIFFLNLKGLSDASVVSFTKNEYGSAVQYILTKSSVLISDEWFIAICWSSPLLKLFVIKKWVVFNLTSFGTLKYEWVIKTREVFNFLPLISNLVTTEFSFESYQQSYHQTLSIFYFPCQGCNS